LVGAAATVILAVGLSGLPPWRVWVQAAIFASASVIALWYPKVLRTDAPFSVEYAAVDSQVWEELMEAERRWREGVIDDATYSAAFNRANVRYRALRPPNAEWQEIISERIRIREEWSRIFASPAQSSDEQRDRLASDERRIRRRIARLS
jgi:hypothetical protein